MPSSRWSWGEGGQKNGAVLSEFCQSAKNPESAAITSEHLTREVPIARSLDELTSRSVHTSLISLPQALRPCRAMLQSRLVAISYEAESLSAYLAGFKGLVSYAE